MNQNNIISFPEVSNDYISNVEYVPEEGIVLITSWDGTLSRYEINQNESNYNISLIEKVDTGFSILSSCHSPEGVYLGGVEGELVFYDTQNKMFQNVDNNVAKSGIIRINRYYDEFIAGSWDGTLQVIDHATNGVVLHKTINDAKILSMDCTAEHLAVSLTGNKTKIYKLPLDDMNNGTLVDSVLKYQTRDIKVIPDGSGYVIGSIDGRVAVEYFNDPSRQFAFRCHRKKLTDVQFVFPVNSLFFKPNGDILFTGGADGCVSCWSLKDRKKIKQYNKVDSQSVVKMAGDDKLLIVATSDDSFKTNAIITQDIDLKPSHAYLVVLDH